MAGLTNLHIEALHASSNVSMKDASPVDQDKPSGQQQFQPERMAKAKAEGGAAEERWLDTQEYQNPAGPTGEHDDPDGIDSDGDEDDEDEKYVDLQDPETRDEFGNFQKLKAFVAIPSGIQ
ncbi:hypothetical protein diail_2310 [Diaporthe ilicicola]|nr:hypothetical protein diail_2310 [Diaporthe ilicicola]